MLRITLLIKREDELSVRLLWLLLQGCCSQCVLRAQHILVLIQYSYICLTNHFFIFILLINVSTIDAFPHECSQSKCISFIICFDFKGVVHELPRIGSDGESEEASGASDEVISPITKNNGNHYISNGNVGNGNVRMRAHWYVLSFDMKRDLQLTLDLTQL